MQTTDNDQLTIRLCEGRFVSHHDVTIGVEFGSRIVAVGPPANAEYGINNPVAVAAKTASKPQKEQRQKHMKVCRKPDGVRADCVAVVMGHRWSRDV